MPQVPVPNEAGITRVQGAPNARVSTSAPIEAFGGGRAAENVTRQAQNLGEQAIQTIEKNQALAAKLAKEEKDKADDVATQDAYTRTVQLRNRLMYDPENGAMNRKGKDAFGAGEEYGKQFEAGADEIENSLTNPEQKALYKRIREGEARDLDSNLTRHTFAQAQAYDEETTAASVSTTREDAVMNYQDPGKVGMSINRQKVLIESNGKRNGQPAEMIKQKQMAAESTTHEAVINRMLANGQDLMASDYYKNIKGSIHGDAVAQVERNLQEGSIRGESQRQAVKIYTTNNDLTSALQAVDKIKDPKIQDATRDRVKQKFLEKEQAKDAAEEQTFRSAFSIVEKTRNKDDIPPDQWDQLSPARKNSITEYLEKAAKKEGVQTDWDAYYNLKQMAASPALRDKFMQTDLLLYRPKLADAEFKELVNAQSDGKKGDTKAIDGIRTDAQIINQSLLDAGVDPTPKQGSKDAKKVNMFWKAVDEEVKALQSQTGKKATNDEVQGIVDKLMTKGVTEKGWFWDTEKRLYEVDPGTDKKFEIKTKDIPLMDRQKIESALRARGINPTDDKINQIYKSKLAGMVNRGR